VLLSLPSRVGGLNMRKMIVAMWALMGLTGCASSESVRQAAIDNCLRVGISQSDPDFPICARSYALQKQDGALYQNYVFQDDMRERDRDPRQRRRADAFRN
jgi:hypothetical protein